MALHEAGAEIFAGNGDRGRTPARSYEIEKLFVFPNGEAVSILFDFSPARPSRYRYLDDGVSGGFFEPLKNAADRGNVRAAFRLYEETSNCQIGPSTEAELERFRDRAGGDARSLESNEAAVEASGYGLAAIAAMSTLRDGRTEPMFVSDRAELLDQLGALMSGSSASVAQGGFRLAKEVLEFQDYWKLTATPRRNWRESLPQPRKL